MLDLQRLNVLLDRYWDTVLTPEERAELEDMFRATAQAREYFWRTAKWHAAMRAWGEADWGQSVPVGGSAIPALCDPATPAPDRDRGLSPPRAAVWLAIVTASAALAAASWWVADAGWWQPVAFAQEAPVPRHVAVITAMEDVAWGGESFSLGQALPPCRLDIESGSAEVTFASGARVLLRGPVEFRVLSPLRGELIRGDLAARVPPGAEGFVVDTPSVEVVDLGTAFGVRVGDDGTADVRVFEGVVETRAEASSTEAFMRLEQDMARRFLPQGGPSFESPATSDQFPVLIPDAPDRPVTSGAIELLRSPPPTLAGLESDDFILMYQERAGAPVSADCLVDIVAPGLYANRSRRPPRPLNKEARVDSYLLHCDTLPRPNQQRPRDKRGAEMRLEGAVTFSRPVVAVLYQRASLDASDDTLGQGAAAYPNRGDPFRGIEPFDSDKIVLSGDRKTLSLSLLVRAQKGRDQVRVLVEAD
ncbi:MAG: hypothetical protein EBR28_12655 [Planctomycetia bacterium]|nr:hypothetical protein [Planctomycetia bacterium]